MATCIKCGKTVPNGELFCRECSLNPFDGSDDAEKPSVTVPEGRMQTPRRAAPAPAAPQTPSAPARQKKGASVAAIILAVLFAAAAGFFAYRYYSQRLSVRLREEALTAREQQYAEMQQQLSALETALTETQAELDAKTEQIKTLQQNINTAESAASQTQFDMEGQLKTLQEEVKALTQELEDAQQKYSTLLEEAAESQEKAAFLDKYVVFVENDGTGLYHRYGCEDFAAGTFWPYGRKLAESSGYRPCPNCLP